MSPRWLSPTSHTHTAVQITDGSVGRHACTYSPASSQKHREERQGKHEQLHRHREREDAQLGSRNQVIRRQFLRAEHVFGDPHTNSSSKNKAANPTSQSLGWTAASAHEFSWHGQQLLVPSALENV